MTFFYLCFNPFTKLRRFIHKNRRVAIHRLGYPACTLWSDRMGDWTATWRSIEWSRLLNRTTSSLSRFGLPQQRQRHSSPSSSISAQFPVSVQWVLAYCDRCLNVTPIFNVRDAIVSSFFPSELPLELARDPQTEVWDTVIRLWQYL